METSIELLPLEDTRLYWPAGQREYQNKFLNRSGVTATEAESLNPGLA
jgi:hypothetical protein